MIRKHVVIGSNVILLLDFTFEIGSFKKQKKTFKELLVDYIKENNIDTFGKKIFLVFGGMLIATFIYFNNDINLYLLDNNYTYTSYFSIINNVPTIEEKKDIKTEITSQKSDALKNKIITNKDTDSQSNFIPNSSNQSKLKVTNNNKAHHSSDKNTSNNNVSSDNKISSDKNFVTVYRSGGSVIELELEEYVLGVVAAEMPASFNIEALKVQAILARTYALKSKQNGKKSTDTVSTQAYIDVSQMKNKWGSDYSKYYNKLKKAVDATKGMYITYKGVIIDAVYHSTSNGYTEDAVHVWGYSMPYLKSVESSWDRSVSSYEKVKDFETKDFLNILGISSLVNVEITGRNVSGRVSSVKVGDNIYSGVDFRTLLSLRSADFDIEIIDDVIRITTRGYGHGVGMSQYGANEMAKKGYTYSEIIKYYYSGVKISNL